MLERIQRIALARILSDLIEADFIVEEREMDFLKRSSLRMDSISARPCLLRPRK